MDDVVELPGGAGDEVGKRIASRPGGAVHRRVPYEGQDGARGKLRAVLGVLAVVGVGVEGVVVGYGQEYFLMKSGVNRWENS